MFCTSLYHCNNPYSGPASAYGVIGKTIAAYFNKVNAEGGINGRKIRFISYDDAYSPPKAVEQARRLVESDKVLLIFQSFGTPSNTAIQKYMNAKKVPQLFCRDRRNQVGRAKAFPLDHGLSAAFLDCDRPMRPVHCRSVPGDSRNTTSTPRGLCANMPAPKLV